MDEAAARAFLRERFGASARVEVMRPGEWSMVYFVRDGDRDLVARFSAYDEDFEKDAYAARYRSAAVPIPPILEWGSAPDGFYAIAERVAGEHVDGLDETGLRRALPALWSALDALRAVELSSASGYGLWRADGRTAYRTWREYLLGVGSGLATRGARPARVALAASPVGLGPFDEGYARLRELVAACPEERHLVHDDLMHYNVLVADDRITALLDWGSSLYGDFLYDVAKLAFYQPWYGQWPTVDFAAEARAHYDAIGLDVPRFAERLTCYMLRIGLGDMAYSAFKERWDELEWKAERTLEIARAR